MLLVMKMVMRLVLTGLSLALIVHALNALRTGRVYSKGLCLERATNSVGYWITIVLYLLGVPWVVVLAWKVS
jgi:succinate dehydrogenase/fumarate reductase cytochrome b subunit